MAIGTLEDCGFVERAPGAPAAPERPRPTRYAALARVTYDDDEDAKSWLLLLRPSVLGTEPADVLSYHAMNPSFPQQSTADQFFDEAQWESYRRLGEAMALAVFETLKPNAAAPASGWDPVFAAGGAAGG